MSFQLYVVLRIMNICVGKAIIYSDNKKHSLCTQIYVSILGF